MTSKYIISVDYHDMDAVNQTAVVVWSNGTVEVASAQQRMFEIQEQLLLQQQCWLEQVPISE